MEKITFPAKKKLSKIQTYSESYLPAAWKPTKDITLTTEITLLKINILTKLTTEKEITPPKSCGFCFEIHSPDLPSSFLWMSFSVNAAFLQVTEKWHSHTENHSPKAPLLCVGALINRYLHWRHFNMTHPNVALRFAQDFCFVFIAT